VEAIREPGTSHPGVRRRIPARADVVAVLRREVAALARRHGATPDEVDDVTLAVSEVVTNVVLHAYAGATEPGVLDLEATARDGLLEVVVADEGKGFGPRDDSPGLGFGLVLAAGVADAVQIQPNRPRGTRVRLRLALAAPQ
jgi:anti-sigma regulatory factor (Ser/Thr protein kinase)